MLGDAPQAPAQKFSTFNTLSLTRLNVPSNNTGGWSIDTADRQLVRSFYNSVYQASEDTPIDWSGDQSTCSAGDTSNDFKNAVLARINFFRAMAGVPANITLNANYSAKSQQAALMMSANNSLNHYPPNSWNCYTADGYEAAGNSNLSLGRNGWDAVAGQMQDNGVNNTATGHRKWILWPQTQSMGTGDVAAANGGYPATNSLWVFDENTFATMPATRDDFVAWPAKGFNPYHIVPIRWSFTYQNADFSSASVSVTQDGNTLPISIDHTENDTFGSIVWRINNMTANSDWPKPTADTIY
ncbi:MAG: CAP domain-containing protein, partial [Gammaproteobacteria bacterium]|nr:CAP domain-containing protein [Gammaproteobacteria bacterium]